MNEKQSTATGRGATPAQLAEAERGLVVGLRRRYSAAWIARNAADLLAAANVEYAEWVQKNGGPAHNPVGWLLNCANWRAADLLDAEGRRPPSTSLDELFHIADDRTPTPEQEALGSDRRERLASALGHLPDKERRLLALVYYGDRSIREAGRELGWEKSAADRHHRVALEKLRALAGDRSLWERSSILVALKAAIDWIRRQLAELGRRLSPAADHASAAASSGGGRLLGACGVAVASVVCGLAASTIAPTGVDDARPAVGPPQPAPASTGSRAELAPANIFPPATAAPAARKSEASGAGAEATATQTTPQRRQASAKNPPAATGKQSRENFEVGATAGEGTPTPEASPAAPSSSSTSSEGSSASSAGGSSPGSSQAPTPVAKEFGP